MRSIGQLTLSSEKSNTVLENETCLDRQREGRAPRVGAVVCLDLVLVLREIGGGLYSIHFYTFVLSTFSLKMLFFLLFVCLL